MTRTATRDRLVGGERIGDYTIERELGVDRYLAVHVLLPRRAVLHIGHGQRSHAVQLLREACVLEALSHPGAPRVFECGLLADHRPWVATELVEGATLADELVLGPLAVSDLVVVVRAIADVLAHAHARGVVHGRIGEADIVRTADRVFPIYVRGWGDVHARDGERTTDAARDVLALGALAYRVLTGVPLVPGASAQRAADSAPLELTKLVDDMIADDPAARPTAAAVRDRADWLAETLRPRAALGRRLITRNDGGHEVSIRIHS